MLVNAFGLRRGRATRDIDFGIAVENWDQFQTLKHRLMESNQFEAAPADAHRLFWNASGSASATPIDVIPFGGLTSESKTICHLKLKVAAFGGIEWPEVGLNTFTLNNRVPRRFPCVEHELAAGSVSVRCPSISHRERPNLELAAAQLVPPSRRRSLSGRAQGRWRQVPTRASRPGQSSPISPHTTPSPFLAWLSSPLHQSR